MHGSAVVVGPDHVVELDEVEQRGARVLGRLGFDARIAQALKQFEQLMPPSLPRRSTQHAGVMQWSGKHSFRDASAS